MARKKGLGRGLDDLLATHDTDLPFLDSYGDSDGVPESGPPPSAGEDDPSQLLAACIRHLCSEGVEIEPIEGTAKAADWLALKVVDVGVQINIESAHPLPLVPSDLAAPGFEQGKLSHDRGTAAVTITRWGVEARRLLSRLVENRSMPN